MQTLISWNVNGVRAAQRKGFLNWLDQTRPDVLCIQETKANPAQLDEALLEPDGYRSFWASAERKGYSGVATFCREEPISIDILGVPEFDCEGRVQVIEFAAYTLINAYFPNSQGEGRRLDYKIAFCNALLQRANSIRSQGRHVIICGDYNIAHKEIDLANPKQNQNNPGFLPEERAWMDTFIAAGYVDTFRMFNTSPDQYTWWSYRFKAREKNIGWRIDYHCVNPEFTDKVHAATILPEIMGSDHCPVTLTVDV